MEDKQADARYWERLNAATKAFNEPDPPGYKGEATREYQKELSRKLLAHGLEKTLETSQTRFKQDHDIAARLLIAGYNNQEVSTALTKASPEAGRLQTKQEREAYGKVITTNTLSHQKVQEQITKTTEHQLEKGQQNERRLEKIGDLATSCGNEKQVMNSRPKLEKFQEHNQRSQNILKDTYDPPR